MARSLVAVHGTDPATVYLSVVARSLDPSVADIESALYVDKALIRLLGMRRTMFVVPSNAAPVVHAACTRAIAVGLRRTTLKLYGEAAFAEDLDTWLRTLENATAAALERRAEATAQELSADVPDLKKQVVFAAGKNYEGVQGVATRILMQLAAEGRIMRGRPRGTWISTQYRWSPTAAWLPGGLADMETDVAQAELDLEPVRDPGPWVALLPALDSTPMGFTERGWFLGAHGPKIFDRSGNIGPTVWSDGRIVGGWAQRKNGTIAYKLLEDVGTEAEHAIEARAHSLATWLGTVRVIPRFRTPLERELSA